MVLTKTKNVMEGLRAKLERHRLAVGALPEDFEAFGHALEILDKAGVLIERPIRIVRKKDGAPPDEGDFVAYRCPNCGRDIATGFWYPPVNSVIRHDSHCSGCGQSINYDKPDFGEEEAR